MLRIRAIRHKFVNSDGRDTDDDNIVLEEVNNEDATGGEVMRNQLPRG